jgi:hypothetical protein
MDLWGAAQNAVEQSASTAPEPGDVQDRYRPVVNILSAGTRGRGALISGLLPLSWDDLSESVPSSPDDTVGSDMFQRLLMDSLQKTLEQASKQSTGHSRHRAGVLVRPVVRDDRRGEVFEPSHSNQSAARAR